MWKRILRLSWSLVAGDSYFAFNATTQIVTRKTNDKKSYSSMSNTPIRGLRIDRLPLEQHHIYYSTISKVTAFSIT